MEKTQTLCKRHCFGGCRGRGHADFFLPPSQPPRGPRSPLPCPPVPALQPGAFLPSVLSLRSPCRLLMPSFSPSPQPLPSVLSHTDVYGGSHLPSSLVSPQPSFVWPLHWDLILTLPPLSSRGCPSPTSPRPICGPVSHQPLLTLL